MDAQQHWDTVYRTKAADAVSWYAPHLQRSLAYVLRAVPDRAARVIDVGGGESTLVDDLLAEGYRALTVLDISARALEVTQQRLGARAAQVRWLVGSVLEADLPARHFDLWHDRAVFHFLTSVDDRRRYVQQVLHALKPGGFAIVATFGPEGPEKCSGLPVARYGAGDLHGTFGQPFELVEAAEEVHTTPWGTPQQFVYCFCRRKAQ